MPRHAVSLKILLSYLKLCEITPLVHNFRDAKPTYHYCAKYKCNRCIIILTILTTVKSATATF